MVLNNVYRNGTSVPSRNGERTKGAWNEGKMKRHARGETVERIKGEASLEQLSSERMDRSCNAINRRGPRFLPVEERSDKSAKMDESERRREETGGDERRGRFARGTFRKHPSFARGLAARRKRQQNVTRRIEEGVEEFQATYPCTGSRGSRRNCAASLVSESSRGARCMLETIFIVAAVNAVIGN